ncbi:MAG: GNAT family N-acetyltransferase [Acidimicrobiales bacterium]|nr:GNAT family N-acetyltransferase [Acidimicrobiales bacterium]
MDDPIPTAEVPLPPGYPAEWDADVVLSDGGTVRIRPIRPDDADRIVDFHGRQSPESIYFRYFTPHPQLTDDEVAHLTNVDYVDRMAFVALRDDVMIGVARYDRWPLRSEAEVAFFVDDAHRGRGMATLLLEYLAEAARRAGISAFTATVLPTNQRMVGVFRAAGFQVRSTFEEGVIEVHLDLQPTPDAMAAIESRAQRAEAEAVRLLLAPGSVAVVGAGRDRHGVGHAVLRNLLVHDVNVPVHPVNPHADHVGGVPAVPSIGDVAGPVDLAIVVVPAVEVPGIVEECGRKGVKAVIVISAGFAESGPEGAALSAATLRAARRFGVRLLGPNCLGVINTDPAIRLHATFATPDPRPGPVALLSESGTIGGALLERIGEAGLGASSFAAIGNRADVSANDLLQFWADDDRTELVLLYLESFGNARKFSRIARALSRTKPIVAVKSGGAARAYPDEGGELNADTLQALVEQTGIIRVDTLAQQLDVARVLACQPLPEGRRVALVGNGGGSLALAADACVDAGLTLATVGEGVHDAVGGEGGSGARLRASTVDLGFEAGGDDLTRALEAVLADDGVDSALVVCAPAPRQPTSDLVAAIAAARSRQPGKTLVACVFGPHPTTIRPPGAAEVPVFDFPDDAAYALGRVTRYARWRAAPEGDRVVPAGAAPDEARRHATAAIAGGHEGQLPTGAAADLLFAAGLPMAASRVAPDVAATVAAAADVGYPVAVKSVGRSRLAKTEAGGVALDVHDEAELRATLTRMAHALGDAVWPVVVQQMVEPGVDVAIGVADSPMVGPVLTVGPGGVATELAVAQVHVLPLTDLEARRFVAGLDLGALLDAPARAHLEDLLLRVGVLVDEAPEIASIELNPVIVSPEAAAIVDAKVTVAPVDRDPLPPVRRL